MWVSSGELAVVRESLGVRRPGMGCWRVFKEERVWVSAEKKYSGIVDTCCSEHLITDCPSVRNLLMVPSGALGEVSRRWI
jgi:hypothetical protein